VDPQGFSEMTPLISVNNNSTLSLLQFIFKNSASILHRLYFYARKQNASRILAIVWASVRLSVRLSVCYTRDLYQNGAS